MKNLKICAGCFILIGASFSNVQAQRYSSADVLFLNSEHKSICEGTELDGSQLVRAFGEGKSASDAKKQLEKNAMRDVLFNGIREGQEGCRVAPLINNPNVRDQHEKYFNKFFSDGGQYKRYVKENDSPGKTTERYKGEGKTKLWTKIVTIDMYKMEKELKQEGIIPKDESKRKQNKKPKKTN